MHSLILCFPCIIIFYIIFNRTKKIMLKTVKCWPWCYWRSHLSHGSSCPTVWYSIGCWGPSFWVMVEIPEDRLDQPLQLVWLTCQWLICTTVHSKAEGSNSIVKDEEAMAVEQGKWVTTCACYTATGHIGEICGCILWVPHMPVPGHVVDHLTHHLTQLFDGIHK